jgi:hypothetical protein
MFKVVGGALLAAVVLMVWGAVFWMVLPFHHFVLKPLPGGDAVVKAMKENIPETGVYLYPWCDGTCDGTASESQRAAVEERLMKQHREGPLVKVVYHKEGLDPMQPATFVNGFLHHFLSALLAGGLLTLALPSLKSYGSRVAFVFLLGVFAAVAVNLTEAIWLHQPWAYTLFYVSMYVSNWLLAGLAMALVIKPARACPAAGGIPESPRA